MAPKGREYKKLKGGDLVCLQLRYANNSNYKNDTMIRKEAFVSTAVLDELRRIIEDSEVGTIL